MSLPVGAVFAPGELKRVVEALKALEHDAHAPREISVQVTLHVHHEYPKHVVTGKTKDGEPITKIVHSAEEEFKLSASHAAPKPPGHAVARRTSNPRPTKPRCTPSN